MAKISSTAIFALLLSFMANGVFAQTFDKIALATDIDTMLMNHYFKKYYPKVIDPNGGIYCGYDRQFNPCPPTEKPLNIESRHLWAASMAMMLDTAYAGFKQSADAAYFYIRDKLWDKTNGGSAIRAGTSIGQYLPCDKPVYANGFALCGLAAYYMATRDTMALHIAITTWKWLESKAYDDQYGMYYGWLNQDGSLANGNRGKNQDILHHWIEGMAWLYIAWPDGRPDSADKALLKKRVKESSDIFTSNKWIRSNGTIVLDNNREMTSGSGVYEGLDVEDVYLFYFYYQAIDTVPPPASLENLKKLVTWTKNSTRAGSHFSTQWWPDAELFTAYCSMEILYNDGEANLESCRKHWNFIKGAYFDPVYGGWYPDVGAVNDKKGFEWCATYHGGKCMLFVRNWLFGSKKGWIDPKKPIVKTRNAGTDQKSRQHAQLRYAVIGFSDRISPRFNTATFYDLMGRSFNFKEIQSRAAHKNSPGMYIAKP